VLIILSISITTNAQFIKGSGLIGGTLSYSSRKVNYPNTAVEYNSTSGNYNISLGKAIRENAVFGININYLPNTSTQQSGNALYKVNINGYGVGIFYRLYKNLGKEFYLFGEAGGGYIGSSFTSRDSLGNKVSTSNTNGGQIYLYPGIAYKISKKFFIELSIPQLFSVAYSSEKSSAPVTSTIDSFKIGATLDSNPLTSLGVGFRLVL